MFAEWNKGELQSYLIEITRDIFSVKEPETGEAVLDKILDTAGSKGTGMWMSQLALDLGVPSTLVTAAVYARYLSTLKEARVRASAVLNAGTGMPHLVAVITTVRHELWALRTALVKYLCNSRFSKFGSFLKASLMRSRNWARMMHPPRQSIAQAP